MGKHVLVGPCRTQLPGRSVGGAHNHHPLCHQGFNDACIRQSRVSGCHCWGHDQYAACIYAQHLRQNARVLHEAMTELHERGLLCMVHVVLLRVKRALPWILLEQSEHGVLDRHWTVDNYEVSLEAAALPWKLLESRNAPFRIRAVKGSVIWTSSKHSRPAGLPEAMLPALHSSMPLSVSWALISPSAAVCRHPDSVRISSEGHHWLRTAESCCELHACMHACW